MLQSVLLKIKVTKQSICRLYPREVELISDELEKLQIVIFNYAVVFPRNYPFVTFLGEINKLLTQDMRIVDAGDSLQVWTTFLMVFELAFHVRLIEMDRIIKNPEKSLPPKQRKMSEMVRGGGASELGCPCL